VFVETDDLAEVAQLLAHRQALRELDDVVVNKREPWPRARELRELVLDVQQPVPERPGLELRPKLRS
jgi:hypothetical protein